MRLVLHLAALLLLAVPARAQCETEAGRATGRAFSPVDTTARLRVAAPAGDVWVDGERRGTVAEWIPVTPGRHAVSLREPAPDAWNPRRSDSTFTVPAGFDRTVEMRLPVRYRVESIPPGAQVVAVGEGAERAMGPAPVAFEPAPGAAGAVVVSRPGYLTQRVPLGAEGGTLLVRLQPARAEDAGSGVEPWRPEARPSYYVDAGLGAAAVGAAALAIYFKFEADRLDDRYAETGDPALRPRIERYDRCALGALVAMQAGVGALAIRWVLR